MTITQAPPEQRSLTPIAWRPIVGAVLAACGLLVPFMGRYGYHRDELYFRMLTPGWGYVDQPPLTPLLARASIAVFGDSVWALRLPAVLALAVSIVLVALTTREVGGGARAQAWSAWGFAFAGFPLSTGHVLVTATVDLTLWVGVLLLITRALLRNPLWWLAAGALVGVSLYNKLLIAMLLVGVAVGFAAVGPRRMLLSRWLWAGIGVALLIGAPNLIYQATHDFPQLAMAHRIAGRHHAAGVWTLLFQTMLLGPPLFVVGVAGFAATFRRPPWRPLRGVAVAYPVALVLTLLSGGQNYYPIGLLAYLVAVGWVPTVDWTAGQSGRSSTVRIALAINALVSALAALPALPVSWVGRSPQPAMNQTVGDQIGWETYVRTLADVYRALPPDQQARAVVFTGNYGEAGAIARFGPANGLPAVYSGHNELYYMGPPPADRTVVIAWTQSITWLIGIFPGCQVKASMDNGVGVDNEEQGSVVAVCSSPAQGWAAAWPSLQHDD